MKILISGANGFVGRYLKESLAKDEIYPVDLTGKGILSCDITDKNAVAKLIGQKLPDQIYHLAAIASPRVKDRELVNSVNVQGTLNILEAVRKFCPKTKVLLVSSGYVYGNCLKPATESSATKPIGVYAESKLEMERQALKKFPDLCIYIARPFTHSGKGQGLGFFFPDMAQKISVAKKETAPVIEVYNPETKRDFSHVKDVVLGYKLIINKGNPGETYNICSGKTYKIIDVVEKMIKRAGISSHTIRTVKHGIILDLAGNCSKIKKLGFKPKFNIDELIAEMIS